MKNTAKVFALIAVTAIIAIMTACSTDSGDSGGGGGGYIPAKWQGTYVYGVPIKTITLSENGTVSWSGLSGMPNGSFSGATIVNGGVGSGSGFTGEWVYLAINGVYRGIIINYSPPVEGKQWLIGLGHWGANEVLSMMAGAGYGINLSPFPNISGFPGFPNGSYGVWVTK